MNKQIVAGSVAAVLALSVQMPTVADERKMALQEVIVTARKKEERIQDAPLSVSAVNTETIEASFLGDTRQLAQYSPNMVFDEIPSGTPRGGGISIRGISLQDVEKTFDPTVLIHVDGVPLGTNTANVLNMLDIERVEVLRGPQGTLFGKNAVGGVINIWRKKPILGQWAGKALVRYDNQDGSNVEGVINVPLGETLAAKINVGREELPGYYENITTGDDEGDSVEKKWGVHLLWQPTDTLTLEAQYNDSDMDGHIAPHLNISNEMTVLCAGFGTCAQSDDTPLSGDRRKGAGNREQSFDLETSDYQFNVNWEISDELTGVLIAGHRELKEDAYYDIDGSELTLFHVRRPNEYEQDSLEARVDYTSTDRFSFSAGYYYWNAKLKDWANEVEIPIFLGLDEDACGFGMIPCQLERASAESDSDSWFFEGDLYLSENWVLTAGARYIEETKKLTKSGDLPVFDMVALPETKGERTDDDTIYRLGLRWEPSESFMGYATYSTGFRSGGFSIRAVSPEIVESGFEPETVESYEIGFKSTLLEQRLRLNLAFFYTEYDDMQIELQIPREGLGSGTQDAVVNAGKAELQGVEMELTAILSDNFSLDFNVGYLDAEYEEFIGQVFADGTQSDDNSSLPLRRAPEWNYTVALNYLLPLDGSEVRARVSYDWRDDYASTVTDSPGTHFDSFGLLDASVSWIHENWQVSLFGRNLTDEDEYTHTLAVVPDSAGGSLFTFAAPRPPRIVGAELRYTFGDY